MCGQCGSRNVSFVVSGIKPWPTMRVYWLFLDTARTVFREAVDLVGVPYRIRTGVAAVRGRCPGPLDEGDEARAAVNNGWRRPDQARAAAVLVAEVDVLQRLFDLEAAGERDRGL